MVDSIRIARGVLAQILDHAQRVPEQECCGLLAGREGAIKKYFPARNALSSSTAYEIAAVELFALVREMRTQQLDLLGIYHSHPHGENVPSISDIERAYYPDAAHFIISPVPGAPRPVRAFRIRDGRFTELSIEEI
ncbi:MAG TPA: M67 family metallopeptidase [Candidatus Acidoferrales bacterium]|nr:M67 family metallopeptidase [Candidatus Acidoferrales bacterium]